MKLRLVTFVFLFASFKGIGQSIDTSKSLFYYDRAYNKIADALTDGEKLSFKETVFITENAYWQEKVKYEDYESRINSSLALIDAWQQANPLNGYKWQDSVSVFNNLGIFIFFTDTIRIIAPDGQVYGHLPLTYDFNDYLGRQDWSNMFVTKLLATGTGNCHNMPYLYKILADELGANCWLSLAPNHIYIKNKSKKIGWYNTELTSGSFPIDAWITASGYIPIKAVQNGIYMDTLSYQQSIALCILDLAKGYESQTKNYADGFILKCCDWVLQYHPVNVQALLLKAEVLKRIYQNALSKDEEVYKQMEALYVKLFESGYREMPEKMYMNWLLSVTKEREKYMNKEIKKVLSK